MTEESMTYAGAGVDISAGNEFVHLIKPFVKATARPGVMGGIGGFGGLFRLTEKLQNYRDPILVSGTDGIGTKLKIAFMADKHDSIGIDGVAMCVNDVVVQGAEPLFFLDYLATGKLEPEKAVQIVKGISEGCIQAGCALIGGETAEMPGFYGPGEYDVAGFCVGIVDKDKMIDGSKISVGNHLIGLASSGLHSNGYSLARKIIFEKMGLEINDELPGLEKTVGDELLTPTRIYVKAILNLLDDFQINGVAHITGGGITENVPRILPVGHKAVIERGSWKASPIFSFLQKHGNIETEEMFKTFNCGIGMVLAVTHGERWDVFHRLEDLGEKPFMIGEIAECEPGKECVQYI